MPKYQSSTPRGDQHGIPAAESKDAPSSGLAAGSVIHRLRSLLGNDVVLLPCANREKGSRWEGWQNLTIGKMQDEPYLRALGRAHNIAVLLGKASGGLCTIDIDGDESIEPFLLLNPKLATTLRSRGKRGCNLWVRIKGDFPRPAMIKRQDGSAWGEWRADRFCTMIHGIHPDGMRYERSPEVPPVEIGFEEIVWPGDLVLPWKLDRTKNESPRQADSGRKWTAGEIGEMLSCIPTRPDYDQWLRVSSAVWSVLGEDEGTALLRAWSPEDKSGEYEEKFKHRLERVTAGTLVHIAKQHGWRGRTPVGPNGSPAMTPEEAIGKFYYDGTIDAVVIDGVADLCASPNDEAESLELISRLHALAQEYSTPIFCVLHENPFGEGKTRGHLGSELNRKAFANLRIEKDAETSVSTMWGLDMRKRDIPQNQGFCFAWDDAAGMHVFQGRAGGIKTAKREEKATTEARQKWEPIFEFAAGNGTNGTCPVLSPDEVADVIRDMNGTKSKPKADTVKKQMQRAETLGVLRKAERGKWSINPTGQTGHERDK